MPADPERGPEDGAERRCGGRKGRRAAHRFGRFRGGPPGTVAGLDSVLGVATSPIW